MSHHADDTNPPDFPSQQRPHQQQRPNQQPPLGPSNMPPPQHHPYSYPGPPSYPSSAPQPPQQAYRAPSWQDASGMPPRNVAPQPQLVLRSGPPPRGQPPYGSPPKPPRFKRRFSLRGRLLLGAITLLIVASAIIYTYYQANVANALSDITGQAAIRSGGGSNADALTQRTNILLLGSDTDGKGNDPTQGTPLAQTVIIVTIDPQTHFVGMLSIPRDMQVSDSTQGYANEKLDEVFEHAWVGKTANERARAAAGHMMDVIEQNYGIALDHYAWVGLQGFIKVIDTVGGVDVDVTHPIMDDLYPDDTSNAGGSVYDYTRLDFSPGPQHLDGEEALNYVRTRHADLGGDFGRTDRQQQVLSQLKEKLSSTTSLSEITALLKDVDGFLMTDLNLSDLSSYAQLAKGIDTNKIEHISLTPPTYAVADLPRNNVGPICDQVNKVIQQMFATQPHCLPQTADTTSTVAGEVVAGSSHNAPRVAASLLTQAASTTTSPLETMSSSIDAPTSVHTLLDVMLLTVFGSFAALQQ